MSLAVSIVAAAQPSIIAGAERAAPLPLAHLTRAAAVTGYVALTLAIALGLLRGISTQAGWRVTWLLDEIHQFIALLAVALVALHLATLALDPLLPFSPLALLLPFGDPARPVAHALGALALYALVVVSLSSWLRRRLPYVFWLRLHGLSFTVFLTATLHGLLAGDDSVHPWMRLVYIACAATAGLLVFIRLLMPSPAEHIPARPSPAPSTPLRRNKPY